MNIKQFGRAVALSLAVATVSMLAGCETQPAFQVSQPSSRVGTVESIRSQTVQNSNATLGTIGGALANADPAACYPAAVLGLGATIRTNKREIAGDNFFKGLYETALEPGEMITAVSFPIPQRAAYVKYKQPASRFALVGVMVSQSAQGVRVGVTGARACAFRVPELEKALTASFTGAATAGVKLAPAGMNADLHGTAEYRAAMVVVMAKRAVEAALAR